MPYESTGEDSRGREIITTPEGFKIHGQNETALIRSLPSLNGIPIKKLEQNMLPMSEYGAWFLGRNESLLEVLANDNDTVQQMGRTHQELADFLFTFTNAPGEMIGNIPEYAVVETNGRRFAHASITHRGYQHSPFEDGTRSDTEHIIVNLETGAKIHYSGLLPEMIHRYGFYEGKGTEYRLDPRDIAKVAGFIETDSNDPIVQLAKNSSLPVEITTLEQMARAINLDVAGLDVLNGQNYRIIPQNLQNLLEICSLLARPPYERDKPEPEEIRKRREKLVTHIDVGKISPQNYLLKTMLAEVVPVEFPQLQQVVLQGISQLQIPAEDEVLTNISETERFLDVSLQGIARSLNRGEDATAEYYEALIKKLPNDAKTMIQIYNAAAAKLNGKPELIALLDRILPNIKTAITAEYKRFGISSDQNATLEQLLKDKGNRERYQNMITESAKFAQEIGGIPHPQIADIAVLISTMNTILTEPEHTYTPTEQEAMNRLNVNPDLIPYALKLTKSSALSLDTAVAQLYNGSANEEMEIERALTNLPENIDQQARNIIEQIIRRQQRLYSGKIKNKAESHNDRGKIEIPASVTENEVFETYLEIITPQFSEFFSQPIVQKTLGKDPYSSQIIELELNQTDLEALPIEIVKPAGRYITKEYRVLSIGQEKYYIDESGIIKNDPEGEEKVSIVSGKMRLPFSIR